MILRGPDAILQVAAKSARADFLQPLRVIEKPEIFFDLNVPHVVPVTDVRRIQFVEQRRQFAFAGNFFITTASLHASLIFLAAA